MQKIWDKFPAFRQLKFGAISPNGQVGKTVNVEPCVNVHFVVVASSAYALSLV